jgi:formylglycine-generating enzyme required for sulfatase activity
MLLLDGGGFSGGMKGTRAGVPVTKPATISASKVYTVTIERIGYSTYTREHVDAESTATLDVTLQDSGELVPIPAGTFQMGQEGLILATPVHTVTLTGFELSIYEITNARYAQYLNAALASGDIEVKTDGEVYGVYGASGAWSGQIYLEFQTRNDPSMCLITYGSSGFSVTPGFENWPVVEVSWYGSKAFANYYDLDLPTEAEWEYACRGGQQYPYGTDDGTISSTKANYDNTIGCPCAVGSYPANPFGLYDMCGNVGEWCHDIRGSYTSDSVTNPTGAQTGNIHTPRGGWYTCKANSCQSASRNLSSTANSKQSYIGFRVVRRPGGVIY